MAKSSPWTQRAQQVFTAEEQAQLTPYLSDVRARIDLREQRFVDQLMLDHVNALRWYLDHGLTLAAAMKRLNPVQLSDFYLRERTAWYPLDTAAKVYPLSMGLKRMMMFRTSFYLKEQVEPEILQMALTYTIRRFPYFATTIKCGFFWHYIDSAMRRFAVRPETKPPCAPIRLNAITSPTFRVVWFGNRVSVEFFHVLTDGTGATIFLKTLLREYLRLLGHEVPLGEGMLNLADAPDSHEWGDDFLIADRHPSPEGFGDKPALQMRGLPTLQQPSRVLHFNLSVAALRKLAKEAGVTITVLMLGVIMLALKEAAEPHGGKRKLHIQLPVNMRRFYPSKTIRNFSMYCAIRLHPMEITTLAEILPKLAEQVRQGTTKDSLDRSMTYSSKLVSFLRFIPLIVKRPIAYLIYGKLSDGVFTTTFSNLGAITLPREVEPYVDKLEMTLGPPIKNRALCSLCSYEDKAVFTVIKTTALPVFENEIYAQLVKLGLEPYVEGTA